MENPQAYGLTILADGEADLPLVVYQNPKEQKRLVNARDLHGLLSVDARFNDWIKRKIGQHRFKHGVDYAESTPEKGFYSKVSKTSEGKKAGGRPSTEYLLSLDAAKIVAMGTNNKVGDRIKLYFLECEQIALAKAVPQAPPIDVMRLLPGIEEHLRPAFQRKQSKALQAFLKEFGGANAVIQHGRTLCEAQTGMSARQIVALGKDVGLAPKQRTSAREVMRHLAPAVACTMSLVDSAVLFGAPREEINELAAEHQDLFAGLIEMGLAPAETWKGPRFLS